MALRLESYVEQTARWPSSGRHILAQFDDESIVVYQAYKPEIGRFAAAQQRFGGGFSYDRMSWIKPNFLWMMYRSGWGTKPGQEVTLAVRIRRDAFDSILREAVHSTYVPEVYGSEAAWKQAVARSDVRLQWDPDHQPRGAKLDRRAIQLGLRGSLLESYGGAWIVEIEDVSSFVAEQRAHVETDRLDLLMTPAETVYSVDDEAVARKLGLGLEIRREKRKAE